MSQIPSLQEEYGPTNLYLTKSPSLSLIPQVSIIHITQSLVYQIDRNFLLGSFPFIHKNEINPMCSVGMYLITSLTSIYWLPFYVSYMANAIPRAINFHANCYFLIEMVTKLCAEADSEHQHIL